MMYTFGVTESYQMLVYTKTGTSDIFDVSTLAHDIQHSTFLHGQPGKLTFILEKDPNNILEISLGDAVSFRYDGQDVFFGYIFKLGTDKTEAYQVVAYDQLRYFANHDYMNCVDMSLVDVFNIICTRGKFKKFSVVTTQGNNKIRDKHFTDVSYFDMMDYAIDDYLKVYKGKNSESEYAKWKIQDDSFDKGEENFLFFVRDNFGVLELMEVSEKYKKDSDAGGGALIIGTNSLLTDYKYELDIDSNTYTQILAIANSKEKGEDGKEKTLKTPVAMKPDGKGANDSEIFALQDRYGVLRKIVNIKNGFEEDKDFQKKLDDYCDMALNLLSRPSKTVKLEALGVTNLNAGDGFLFQLDKLNVKQDVYIVSAVHNYGADIHTMSLEIAAIGNMPETLGRM